MARNQHTDDDEVDSPEADAQKLAAASDKADDKEEKGGKDDLPMHVAEDGTVTFGDADARGERTAKVGDEEEDEHEEAGLTDAQREQLRAKRREEKKRRREAQKRREDELKGKNAAQEAELNALRTRLAAIEQRTTAIDVSRVDNEIEAAGYAATYWENAFQEAVTKQDGATAAKAMTELSNAKGRAQQLVNFKAQLAAPQQVNQGVDPIVQVRVDQWRAKHTWYNPTKPDDRDTQIALAVDRMVAAKGFKPTTQEFWDELDRQLSEVLPHRYEEDGDDDGDTTPAAGKRGDGATPGVRSSPTNRRVPATGGGSSTGSAPASIKLAPERVQAMKDAGQWEDPKKREAMIRKFMEYDKANRK